MGDAPARALGEDDRIRRAHAEHETVEGILSRVADATGCYLYAGRLHRDERWELLHRGPGLDRLVGRPVAPEEGDEAFVAAVHPEDRAAWQAASSFDLLEREGRVVVELRLIGADGATRWVRDTYLARPDGRGALLIDGVTLDITRERASAEEAEEAYAMLRAAADAVAAYLYVMEADGVGGYRTVYEGPGLDALMGCDRDTPVSDAEFDAAVHADDRADYDAAFQRNLLGHDTESEYRRRGRDGVVRWVSDIARARRLPDGRVRIEGLIYDVSERRRMLEELELARHDAERRSRTDSLTGAFNRRHVAEAIHAELRRAQREGGAPGVVVIDLDGFKRVNDTHGHQAGDAVLVEVVRRLHAAVRPYDVVGRWGGEELAVLVPAVPDDESLRAIGEQLRNAVRMQPVTIDEQTRLRVTASVGAARAEPGLWSVDGLLDAADRALYAAKRRGRDRVVLISDLTVEDLVAEEPEAIRLARALALQAALRESMPERHAEEVAELAEATATRMGLSPTTVYRCRLGGWLHDVGKTSLPDSILLHAEPLEDVQWEALRAHVIQGEAVVRQVAGLGEAGDAVRHHHERWDGEGYPDGLAGDAIPIEARVVAACNAYSSMTTARPFRAARAVTDAVDELRRGAGHQFDPVVVAALVAVLEGSPEGDFEPVERLLEP
jgi:diguanylate cyclase (GGDEF)-like protein